ncbi:MAG: glycosyltransferase family 4 protein [Bacteroidota bacterium]
MRVGIIFTGVANEHVGGAERFFADFYDIYNRQSKKQNDVFFITDKNSCDVYTKKLKKLRYTKNIILIPNFNNRFKNTLESFFFLLKLILKRIDIIHIGSYGRHYYHLLDSIKFLPIFLRPKIVINIVDCEIPYVLGNSSDPKHSSYKAKYLPLFDDIKIDAVYSWYKLFKQFAESKGIIKSNPLIESVATRFSDTARFISAANKKNEIIFAARLTHQKQPLFFLKAIRILKANFFEDIKGWKFLIYGKGPLEKDVQEFISNNGLEELISGHSNSDLSKVFSETKCFVSTQDYENFPSLSMCEAMAAGNAVIARNVGQTDFFVKHDVNGYVLDNDTPEGLAYMLHKYITSPQNHLRMQNESVRLTKEVHTADNFIRDIDSFWKKVNQ